MSGRNPFENLTGLAALSEIGRRLGNLGEQVKGSVQEAQAKAAAGQSGEESGERRFTLTTSKGTVEGVSQMSFRIGSLSDRMSMSRGARASGGAAARAEHTRKTAPDVDGAREPMLDCFDEGDGLVITAELPGVSAGEVKVTLDSGDLLIETTGARRYRTRQTLGQSVDPKSLRHELRNGILEARINKAGASA